VSTSPQPRSVPAEIETLVATVRFDSAGLVPAVAQDALTGEVRMVAFMNADALCATFATGEVHFYSRSRSALWKKGESSGNTLALRSVHLDCDGDAVLVLVEPRGPTCHTGAASCFFRTPSVEAGATKNNARGWVDGSRPFAMAERLELALEARRARSADGSYTRRLLDAGADAIGAKIREEADELARAIASEDDGRVVGEAADVVYHVFVGLLSRSVPWRAVLGELARRFGVGGLVERAARARSAHRDE